MNGQRFSLQWQFERFSNDKLIKFAFLLNLFFVLLCFFFAQHISNKHAEFALRYVYDFSGKMKTDKYSLYDLTNKVYEQNQYFSIVCATVCLESNFVTTQNWLFVDFIKGWSSIQSIGQSPIDQRFSRF